MGSNSCEVEDVRTRFVFETPLGGSVSADGNFWFGTAGSDVSTVIGDCEIKTMGYGIAATARWLSDAGLCAGGQVQYAGFASDIVVGREPQAADNNAFYLSVAAEVDCRFPCAA